MKQSLTLLALLTTTVAFAQPKVV
ncbi:MAG: hypothetical protein RLZZ172_2603, partial [Bacteroidota bacterium]